jgi:hypothetical protein
VGGGGETLDINIQVLFTVWTITIDHRVCRGDSFLKTSVTPIQTCSLLYVAPLMIRDQVRITAKYYSLYGSSSSNGTCSLFTVAFYCSLSEALAA